MARRSLKDKGVLLTGASSGIGYSLALALGAAGTRQVLVARRKERLEALADRIAATGGYRPLVVAADLSVRGEAARAAKEALSALDRIDVLVNNAGGAVGGSIWAVADADEARADFEVDFWSPLALIGAVVPEMRRRGDGTVVNVTSIRQVFAWPSFGHNTAAKAALALATETLRLELMRFGVYVVEVVPGPISTPSQGPTALLPGIAEVVHNRFGMAAPEEIAAMVVDAIQDRTDRVFCPAATTKAAYDEPVRFRAEIAEEVRRIFSDAEASDEMIDHLVVGSEHPLIVQAREAWEAEHAPSASL